MSGGQESGATHIIAQQQHESSSFKDIHTAFGFVIGLLLTLVGIKYQGRGSTLFKQNRLIMSFFIAAVCFYASALVKTTLISTRADHHNLHHQNSFFSRPYYTAVFLTAGTSASELLLYILLGPVGLLGLNILVSAFLAVQQYCNQQMITAAGTRMAVLLVYINSLRNFFATIFTKSSSTQTNVGGTTAAAQSHGVQISNVV